VATASSLWKRTENYVLVVLLAAVLFSISLPGGSSRIRGSEAKSLSNAKDICLACKEYAIDNDGNFPPSLDALFPKYLTDRSVLVSHLLPSEPVGYTYTPPGLGKTNSPDTVVIEDKFAPTLTHDRIVVYADDSARILKIP
jgi:hypothetical protein